MSLKMKGKLLVDILMTGSLLGLMAYSLLGEEIHEWLGIMMFFFAILHKLLNRSWVCGLRKGRWNRYRKVQTTVTVLLFLTMMGSMISGILISQYVFSFLPISGGKEMARLIHLFCGYWGFVLMSFHLGLHWKMILGIFRKRFGIGMSAGKSRAARGAAFLTAVYGAFVFYKEDILSYLFLQTHFVFLDFNKTLAGFILEYLVMMELFALAAYYGSRFLQKQKKVKILK